MNLVSKHFNRIISDNELWRTLCFRHSNSRYATDRTPPRSVVDRKLYDLQEAVAKSETSRTLVEDDGNGRGSGIALWDHTISAEKVNWRSDYIGRHASLAIDWIHDPNTSGNNSREDVEATGLAAIDESRVLASLSNGSIRVWDVDPTGSRYGQMLHRTRPGQLFGGVDRFNSTVQAPSVEDRLIGLTSEGLSVDGNRNKAYCVVGQDLVELDLTTMAVSARNRYPEAITVLSDASKSHPLTVGTAKALYLYDSRAKSRNWMQMAAIKDHLKNTSDFYRLITATPEVAPLAEPRPLSIVHTGDHSIHVAGRFPSILNYDRRYFPQMTSSIHSGARLSCLAAIPSAGDEIKLAAAGDYNGKGSIDLYSLSATTSKPRPSGSSRNRTSASRSKCLSIVSHGSRLLFSDGDGMVKWIERDGVTPVRRWNINSYSENVIEALNFPGPRGGIFSADIGNGDVARRLVPTSDRPDADVCVWTGEKVGVMHFGRKRQLDEKSTDEEPAIPEPASDEERSYGRMMRRALEQQADETRFMTGLGLGRSV